MDIRDLGINITVSYDGLTLIRNSLKDTRNKFLLEVKKINKELEVHPDCLDYHRLRVLLTAYEKEMDGAEDLERVLGYLQDNVAKAFMEKEKQLGSIGELAAPVEPTEEDIAKVDRLVVQDSNQPLGCTSSIDFSVST